MKAARLIEKGKPLAVSEVSSPKLQAGGIIARVLATLVPNFATEVVDGSRPYALPPLPTTPGTIAVGIVEEVAEDVIGVQVGQLVYLDNVVSLPAHRAREVGLIGWTAITPGGLNLMAKWKEGSWAEKVLWPATSALVIPDEAKTLDPSLLVSIGYASIAYGGVLRGNLRAGQTVIVNGATGALGSAGVLLALALGAAKVVALGRDKGALEALAKADARVVTVNVGDSQFKETLSRLLPHGADFVLDALGGTAPAELTAAAFDALKWRGTAVFIGGNPSSVSVPYTTLMLKELSLLGSFMCDPTDIINLFRLSGLGIFRSDIFKIHTYPLEKINEAVADASKRKGIEYTVVVPSQ